jgi:RNA polymerase sigma-70 factor (ECF subfamily)
MTAGLSDETLLQRHLGGDRHAFGELIRRHERRVYGVCLRMLGNVEDAQDAAQEAFLSALRRAGTFAGGAAFSTWLYRVAVNAAIDLGRRRSRHRTVAWEPDTDRGPAAPDPSAAVVTSLTVQAALARLPEDARVAIILCDLYRLPYAEVADILEVAVGTVKSRVFRARFALARELQGGAAAGSTDAAAPGTGTDARASDDKRGDPVTGQPRGTDQTPTTQQPPVQESAP